MSSHPPDCPCQSWRACMSSCWCSGEAACTAAALPGRSAAARTVPCTGCWNWSGKNAAAPQTTMTCLCVERNFISTISPLHTLRLFHAQQIKIFSGYPACFGNKWWLVGKGWASRGHLSDWRGPEATEGSDWTKVTGCSPRLCLLCYQLHPGWRHSTVHLEMQTSKATQVNKSHSRSFMFKHVQFLMISDNCVWSRHVYLLIIGGTGSFTGDGVIKVTTDNEWQLINT